MRYFFSLYKLSFVLLGILLLSACATTLKYRQKLNAWHGKNIQQFVNLWGYPDHTIKAPDGNRVYVYKERDVTSFPTYTSAGYTAVSTDSGKTVVTQVPSITSGGGIYTFSCTTWVELIKRGIIVNTSFKGNDCVSD